MRFEHSARNSRAGRASSGPIRSGAPPRGVMGAASAVLERLEARALLSAAGGANDLVMLRPAITVVDELARPPKGAPKAVVLPGFQIEVVFPDNSLTPSQKAVFTTAAHRWMGLIQGDVPDFTGNLGNGVETVDDVRIAATGPAIDGVGKVLGSAGPTALRPGNNLPIIGQMMFDSADLANLEATGQLDEVILHEMGHVLGLGTIWTNRGVITGAGGANPRYTGPLAIAQYQAIFGVATADIPVENTGGLGSADGHWREVGGAGVAFDKELMTGILDSGVVPLSRVTIAQYADLGYKSVNINGFDVFNPTDGGNAYPTISSISDGPDPSPVNAGFLLTANGVADANGTVASTKFYRETNNIPGLQVMVGTVGDITGDLLLSTDSTPADGFTAAVATTGLPTGTYTYYAQATDNQGLVGVAVSGTNTISVATPPVLQSITINDNTAQRSQVNSISLTFDKPVTLGAGATTLLRLNSGGSGLNDNSPATNASAVLAPPTPSNGGATWTYSFVGGNPFMETSNGNPTGSLVDGIYTASVDPTKVTANGFPMLAGGTLTFHRLFGDIDGNKSANNLDFGMFRNTSSKSTGQAGFIAAFDFDGNGSVNNADFGQFRNRSGKGLTY